MTHLLSVALIGVGLVSIIWGIVAEVSQSDGATYFPGSLRNKSIWLLIAGVVFALSGFAVLMRVGGVS